MDWEKYFNMLKDWKKLPAYRFEPRLDSIIGYYLPKIVSDIKGKKIVENGIIPEFPIRKKTIVQKILSEESRLHKEHENSNRVDFLLIAEDGPNYLVEFKTDSNSRRKKQDDYLLKAKEKKLDALINGINSIYSVTKFTDKYAHLKKLLEDLSLIDKEYPGFKFKDGKNKEIEIIYVQPTKEKENENYKFIDFKEIYDWFCKRPKNDFETELSETLLDIHKKEKAVKLKENKSEYEEKTAR